MNAPQMITFYSEERKTATSYGHFAFVCK